MKLYCMRHGEAEFAENHPERPLTERGREEVERVARYLQRCDIKVGHILHSTKSRAQQTAEILARYLLPGEPTECESILDADANVDTLIEMIAVWSDDTFLVGHLPFIPKLVSGLVIENADYYPIVNCPPASVVCLDHYHQERWIIQWLLNPQLIVAE